MTVEDKLTASQCSEIAWHIVEILHNLCAGGTQFGIDWPTMRVLYPVKCRVFKRLKARYHSLTGRDDISR